MNVEDVLVNYQIGLRLWQRVFAPSATMREALMTAIQKANQERQIADLDHELDPYLIAPAKVAKFLDGLSSLPETSKTSLRNRLIYLNAPGLMLHYGTALTAERLAAGYTLIIPTADELVEPVIQVEFDLPYVQELVQRARAATHNFNEEVAHWETALAEAKKYGPEFKTAQAALANARAKRHSAAMVWRDNSDFLYQRLNDDPFWQTEAAKSAQAASDYSMPPRTGMPQPPG